MFPFADNGLGPTYSHWLRCCPEAGTTASLKYTLQILTCPYVPPIVAMIVSLTQEQSYLNVVARSGANFWGIGLSFLPHPFW